MRAAGQVWPVAVPGEVWKRLAALDRRCNIEMRREDVPSCGTGRGTGRLYDRKWVVVFRDRAGRDGAVKCEAPALVQALEGALEEAERRGWAAAAL